ncbi:hypothetical protein DRO91_01720 [Candidatus Heimdallarchaeota archaeon]|nr:MAG: hypothetical protein DRO91_01720 [Candidatus Heimdallarchaeota archaeon]
MFIVPIFSIILFNYNVPFTTIVGSSAAGCFINGLISTIINMRRREVDWFLALIFEVPTAAGIFLGAFLTTRIDERITTSIFAAFAITLFLRIFHEKRHAREVFSIERNGVTLTEENDGGEKAKTPSGMSPPSEEEESATAKKIAVDKRLRKEIHKQKSFIHRLASFRPKWRIERETYSYSINIFMLIAVALAIGSLAGMVGCGGGWVKAPVLISGFGVPSLIAISTGMLMTTITLLFTGVIHIIWGQFALWLWTIIAIGSVFGAFIGSALKRRFSSKALQLTMIVTLTAITILLLVKTWLGL